MKRRLVCLSILLALVAVLAPAQVATGTPEFNTFAGGPFDLVNTGNLNVHFAIPVLHKQGRGLPFSYDATYDGSIWTPVTVQGKLTWQPAANWGWSVGLSGQQLAGDVTGQLSQQQYCLAITGIQVWIYTYTNFVYTDPWGASHPLPGTLSTSNYPSYPQSMFISGSCAPLQSLHMQFSGTTTDGSGLSYFVTAANLYPTYSAITTPGGQILYPTTSGVSASSLVQDANGNELTADGSGHFYDTLSATTPALTVSGNGNPTSPIVASYAAPGGTAKYRINYTEYTIRTNFGFTGTGAITEYGPLSIPLISSITLPDGSSYIFGYEQTPGTCTPLQGTYVNNCTTARIASVTLPTGGQISYAYSGGPNGTGTFSDGSTAALTRTLTPGGEWQYVRALVSGTPGPGSVWTTTIADPNNNQTVSNFSEDSATSSNTHSLYETKRQTYQGTTSTGSLLRTLVKCYNQGCTSTTTTSPITYVGTYNVLPNGTTSAATVQYNGGGLPIQTYTYDYGVTVGQLSTAHLIRQELIYYAAVPNGPTDRPSSITISDGTGNIASTSFYYDQVSPTATTGTPQHVPVGTGRGNLTTAYVATGTQSLESTYSYWDTGNIAIATDINGAQTSYGYSSASASCGNSFPTSVTQPPNISSSYTWNCAGSVLTQIKDANLNNTVAAYGNNVSYWLPDSATDQTSAKVTFSYPSPNATESALAVNSGSSIVDVRTTADGFGRAELRQVLQSPNSSSYDTVEQDYDAVGRVNRSTLPFPASAGATNSSAAATNTQYDALGRAVLVTDAGGGTVQYSYNQNDVLMTIGPAAAAENAKQRQLEYDGLGRLTSVCELTTASGSGTCGQTVAQTGYWTKYSYNALGHLTGVTQNAQAAASAQQTRSYSYDMLGRLLTESNPESGTVQYTYDSGSSCGSSAGDLVKIVDALGNTTCIAHDAAHRVTSRTYSGTYASNTPNKYYVYDSATVNKLTMKNGNGLLVEAYTATSSTGTKITDVGYSYSARGEVSDVYQSTPHSGGYYHLNQTYWENSAPKVLSGLTGFPALTYGVDGEGRPNSAADSTPNSLVTSALYNVFGQVYQVNFGSNDSDVFSFDPNTGRMTGYQFNVKNQAMTGAMAWNSNGTLQKLVIVDPFNSADNQTCKYGDPTASPAVPGYDDLNRLIGVNCGSVWSQTFSYDPFGNLSKNGTIQFLPVYANASGTTTNRYVGVPYDSNGNVLNDGAHSYAWDADGNPSTIDGVALTYDGLDRVVERNKSGVYSQVVYAPTGKKLALMSGQSLTEAFVPLPGGAEAVYSAAGLNVYRHKDWLGNNRLDSTPSQTVASTAAYAPFGETYAPSSPADPSFTGQNPDTVPGLYDFLYREYNATQGRWPSPDPAGVAAVNPANPQSWNRYAYVLNNPLLYVDQYGLDCIYDNGDGTASVESGDCGSVSDDGYYVPGTIVGPVTIDANGIFVFSIQGSNLVWGVNGDTGAVTPYSLGVTIDATPANSGQVWIIGPQPGSSEYAVAVFSQVYQEASPIKHPCFWASWTKSAAIAGGGVAAVKGAVAEGVSQMSLGQKILGGVAGYKVATGMMGPFYDAAIKPISNLQNSIGNAICSAIGD